MTCPCGKRTNEFGARELCCACAGRRPAAAFCAAAPQPGIYSRLPRPESKEPWTVKDALAQQDRLTPFLQDYCGQKYPVEIDDWQNLVIGYLTHIGRWETVRPYLDA